jgi:hypothetical protein
VRDASRVRPASPLLAGALCLAGTLKPAALTDHFRRTTDSSITRKETRMRAIFIGSGVSFVTAYEKVLLLRDNVQHHLQAGRPGPGYPWIHQLADVRFLCEGHAHLPAAELWQEVSAALGRIRELDIQDLAMSIRTRALLVGVGGLPPVRGTILLRLSRWRSPIRTRDVGTLGELFDDLALGLERVTASGKAAGEIEATFAFDSRTLRPGYEVLRTRGESDRHR